MTRTADLILTGVRLPGGEAASGAVAIADGRILATGHAEEAAGLAGPTTRLRDLDGATVLPGLVDAHNHHAEAGVRDLFELTFPADSGLDEVLTAVAAHARSLPADAWITGGDWGTGLLTALRTEEARLRLDEAAGGRPVHLSDDSHHNCWASSRALVLCGLLDGDAGGRAGAGPAGTDREEAAARAARLDPGLVVRDPATGRPTGLLLDEANLHAEGIAHASLRLTDAQWERASRHAIGVLHAHGVTAFQDASIAPETMRALQRLDAVGGLDAWVSSCVAVDPRRAEGPGGLSAELDEAARLCRGTASTHHRPGFVKLFLDGTPPARTGAFLSPYLPDAEHGDRFRGATLLTVDETAAWLRGAAERGLGVKMHCAGDAAVRTALDATAALRAEEARGLPHVRVHVAHGQFVHPDDIPRFAALDVTADVSPHLWFPGMIPDALAAVRPGGEFARFQPNRDLLDAGARLAVGSDWPVSDPPDALGALRSLVTRADASGTRGGTLGEGQAITPAEALRATTADAAEATGLGDVSGALQPGRSADLIVLDGDPFAADVEPRALLRETWFAGRPVSTPTPLQGRAHGRGRNGRP